MPDAEKLAAVREALPALSAGIYLASGEVGPLPSETAAAMDEYAQRELRTGRGHPDDVEAAIERIDEARAGVAAILATDVDAVTLTHGASEALARAVAEVDWRSGDRLLAIGRAEPSSTVARSVADRLGVALDAIEPVDDDGDDERVVEAVRAAIGPATRLVVVPHVLATTGARVPIERIAAEAHDAGAVVAVDGSQAVGAVPVVVEDSGADFYAVAGEKWLLGPDGIGALWTAPAHRGRGLGPVEFHTPSVVGFARSCGWLSMYVGLPWIHARGSVLAHAAAERLATIDGVELLTPRERMATLVTFRIRGWPAEAALAELGARVFAIAGAVPSLEAIRIGVGFFTTEDELERFASAVELLAAHTPSTLPPKPRLTILGQDGR
jgi:L-cysteine/cystine lyase